MTHLTQNLVQYGARIRDDSEALNSIVWTYAQGSTPALPTATVFRVRIGMEEQGGLVGACSGILEASHNAGTYFDVTTSSSVVKAVPSAQFTNGENVTFAQLTGRTMLFTYGEGSEDGTASQFGLLSNALEHEYSFEIVDADVADGDTLTFRFKESADGTDTDLQDGTATVSKPSDPLPRSARQRPIMQAVPRASVY